MQSPSFPSAVLRPAALVSIVLGLAACGAPTDPGPQEAPGSPTPSVSAQVLVAWNERVFAVAEAEDRFLTLKGLHTAALMHLAVHDALNTLEPRYETYLQAEQSGETQDGDPLAAVATAAYRVAVDQYPDQQEVFDAERVRWLGEAASP